MRPWLWALCLALPVMAGCSSRDSQGQEPSPDQGRCTLVKDDFGPPGTVAFRVEVVASQLEVPWGLAFLPEGDMLITERPGRLRLVRQGSLVEKPVAVVPVKEGGEGGLLGLALHPRFLENRAFYIYTTASGERGELNQVERWILAPDGLSARPDRVIVQAIPAARYHNGGRIRFGPDNLLYIATGDAKEPQLAQDPKSLAGKLLRVTDQGAPVEGNLSAGNPAYLMGIRNSEGFDWGPQGWLMVADHGPSGEMGRYGHDEISVVRPGANLGWPTIYGCQTKPNMVAPSLSWTKAVPPGGAAIYRGNRIAEWRGDLMVGTLGSRHLHRLSFHPQDTQKVTLHEVYLQGDPPQGYGRLREVVMGPEGDLYVTTSNCDGRGTCPDDKDKVLRLTR